LINDRFDEIGKLEFDKDDQVTLDFVSSVSNFRAFNYSIARETHFKIKEIAGNIPPAVSSTNGLVAAVETAETIKILNQSYNVLKAVSY